MTHQWYYRVSGIHNDSQIGPLTDNEILAAAREGKLKRNTPVWSPTRTKGEWLPTERVPAFLKLIEGIEAQQQANANAIRAQKEAEALAARQQRHSNEAARRTAYEQERARLMSITDCEDLTTAAKLEREARNLLTQGEVIEYLAVQQKPVNIKPDAIVATNRRIIIFRSKILGQFSFDDYLWRDLGDAHVIQGIMGSTITLRHVSGRIVSLDWLPKQVALKVYRIAQHREEEAIEVRRQREMEIRRSSAANISLGAVAPMPAVEPNSGNSNKGNPLERIKTLKEMLDNNLITQADFEKRKAEILSEI